MRGDASIVSRIRRNVIESLCGLGDVSLCSKVGRWMKWEEISGNSRKAERMASPSAWVWSKPMKERKRVDTV